MARSQFLEIGFLCCVCVHFVYACVRVCAPLRAFITSHMIRTGNQVIQLSVSLYGTDNLGTV